MKAVLALESLQNEILFIAQKSFNDGRDNLDDLEIEHLIKMSADVVAKIKKCALERYHD